nr:Abi family protein [uncultured Psychroserpens sp.]
MGGVAIDIDKQIEKLQGRGMDMDLGIEKAKEVLMDIGYYRLGFYWNPFEINKDHDLIKGTKFSNVLDLYYLDVDLKNILNRAINRIEINFKTKLIYHTSLKFDKNPIWFTNRHVVSQVYIDKFPDAYNILKKHAKPIQKHHVKYPRDDYAPAWKTLEFLTFGSVITMYTHLGNTALKLKIASEFNLKSIAVFENFLLSILYIRNICAHSDLLYDANRPTEIATTPIVKFNNNNRHCLDSSMKVILYFLKQISEDRHDKIQSQIDELFEDFKNNVIIKDIIEKKIGYVYN